MYLCDVPAGSIVCFKGSANYWMKEQCGIDPDTCYVVAKTVNELYTEGV